MAQVEWAFLCDYAFKDMGRKMCLIGIFKSIIAPKVPWMHPHASLVVRINGSPGEKIPIRIDLNRPTGGRLAQVTGEMVIGQLPPGIDTGGESPGDAVPFNMASMLLPDYGSYSIDIYLNDELERTLRFRVMPPPKPTPGAH